jgi:hypothetical protein
MSSNDLTNIVKKMLEDTPATFLDVDMTWNLPNELMISNQLLILMMAKIASIPIISNTDKIYTSLNSAPVSSIEEINKQFNLLQIIAQKYCVQQFTLGQLTHNLFDDIINNSIELSNDKIVESFMNIIGTPKFENQKGGNKSLLSLVNFLLILFVIINTNSADMIVYKSNIDDKKQITEYLELDKNTFIEKDFVKSRPVKIEYALRKYDEKIEMQQKTLSGSIMALFKKIVTSDEKMQEYITNFNKRSINISDSFEKACTTLMIESYDQHIFKNWNNMDSASDTTRKIKELNEIVHAANEDMVEGIPGKMANVLMTTATSLMSGDFIAPASLLVDYGFDAVSKLKTIKDTNKEIKQVLKEKEETGLVSQLTGEEKVLLHEGLFEDARYSCSSSFNLQIHYEDGMLSLEGDKVDYKWMMILINSLQENIDMRNATIVADNTIDEKSKEISFNLLKSLQERFNVLKEVIRSLSYIINYGVYGSLTKKIRHPSEESLDMIKVYFDEQLNYLNSLLDNLQKLFPEEEKKISRNLKLVEEKKRLQEAENELTIAADTLNNLQRSFEAQRISLYLDSIWVYFNSTTSSYIDFGIKTLGLASEKAEIIASSATELVMSGPLGVIKGFGDKLSDLLVHLLTTTGGLVLAGTGMLALFVLFTGPVFTFIYAGKKFIYFVVNGVIFVYEVIKTTLGYGLKPVATFVLTGDKDKEQQIIYTEEGEKVENVENYNKFLAGREEGEIYNPTTKYGGEKKKKRQTKKKQTNKKTKKNKRNKKKHTKRKNNKKTKVRR